MKVMDRFHPVESYIIEHWENFNVFAFMWPRRDVSEVNRNIQFQFRCEVGQR